MENNSGSNSKKPNPVVKFFRRLKSQLVKKFTFSFRRNKNKKNDNKVVLPKGYPSDSRYYLDSSLLEPLIKNLIEIVDKEHENQYFAEFIDLYSSIFAIKKEVDFVSIANELIIPLIKQKLHHKSIFIIPCVYNSHWILFYVSLQDETIYTHDSLMMYCDDATYINPFYITFKQRFSIIFGVNISSFKIVFDKTTLRQEDSDKVNCGMFVLIKIYRLLNMSVNKTIKNPTFNYIDFWKLRTYSYDTALMAQKIAELHQ
uniref:ULP_PROTEASE domain-containing protein n=1 Tax=Parastrongyloides trichosuri TaxID=131310 RepID=A0A0N4Z033_PARTI